MTDDDDDDDEVDEESKFQTPKMKKSSNYDDYLQANPQYSIKDSIDSSR